MVRSHLDSAVDDGGADIVHHRVRKGLQDEFVADAVGVSVGDTDFQRSASGQRPAIFVFLAPVFGGGVMGAFFVSHIW